MDIWDRPEIHVLERPSPDPVGDFINLESVRTHGIPYRIYRITFEPLRWRHGAGKIHTGWKANVWAPDGKKWSSEFYTERKEAYESALLMIEKRDELRAR